MTKKLRAALNPWDDAVEISRILSKQAGHLIVLFGAEAWCEKCRRLKPVFDELVQRAAPHEVMLWLDLEDHAEFFGSYIPESLPELCIYRRGELVIKVQLDGTERSLHDTLAYTTPTDVAITEDPGVFARLIRQDWAQSF